MKALTLAGLVCVTAMLGVGCGDAVEFDPEDLDVEVSSQELSVHTASFTLTSYNTRTLQLQGLDEDTLPAPEDDDPTTFSLKTLSYAGFIRTASYGAASPLRAAPARGKCGKCCKLARQWSKVLSRKDWGPAKKRRRIINVLLPRMANNKCKANITYSKGAEGVKRVEKISPP